MANISEKIREARLEMVGPVNVVSGQNPTGQNPTGQNPTGQNATT